MNKPIAFNSLLTLLAVGLATIIVQSVPETRALLNSPLPTPAPFDSPLPTPVPSPSPTPGPSVEAQKALAYLAQREEIAPEALVIVNEFRRAAPLLGLTFQAVTVLDTESGHFFQVLVDLDSGQVEDRTAVEEAEEQNHRAKYGKLQPALYELLEAMGEDETVTIAIWVAAPPGKSLAEQQSAAFETLAARYPQARAAMERSGKPMDVDDPALAEHIYDEYVQIVNAEVASRVHPLVEALEAQGFAVRTAEGLPAVTVTLPKGNVKVLAARDDIGVIYLSEGGQRTLALDSAVQTNLAPAVWREATTAPE